MHQFLFFSSNYLTVLCPGVEPEAEQVVGPIFEPPSWQKGRHSSSKRISSAEIIIIVLIIIDCFVLFADCFNLGAAIDFDRG